MSAPSDDALLQILTRTLKLLQATNYAIASAVAFLLYDIFLSLALEVTYIWRTKWSLPKLAYLVVRYYGLVHLVAMSGISFSTVNSVQTCKHYFAFLAIGGPMVFYTISNLILMFRIHALYGRRLDILIFLIVIVAGQFGVDLYTAIRNAREEVDATIPVPLIPGWPGCAVSHSQTRYTLIAWIPLILVATIFFAMTLANFIQTVRASNVGTFGRRKLHEIYHISPILSAFVRDGTVFYFLLLVILVISMVLSALIQGPPALAGDAWLITVYSFATSRLILNLREFADQSGHVVSMIQTLSMQVRSRITEDSGDTEVWMLELNERPQRSDVLTIRS